MFFTFLGRTIKLGFQNFFRNAWLSVVTVVILLLTIFLITLLSTMNLVGNQAINLVTEKVDMDLYFEVGTESADVLEVKEYLENSNKVALVTYVSPDDALIDFKASYINNPTILESLDELATNPLPASLVVQAVELEFYQDIIALIDGSEYSELIETKDYQDNQVVVNRISEIINKFKLIAMIVSAIFAAVSLLVVFNTFRIAIYAHREELGIMKLVGANNSFVRAPFIFEGVIYAVVATVVTMAVYYPLLILIAPYINGFFEGYDLSVVSIFNSYFWLILTVQFLSALVITILSSLIAVGRYLKV